MKKTSEFYVELSKLIKTIPAPASVVFDVMTYKKACEDYQTALFYVGEILSNHATYEKWKSQLGKGTVMMNSFCNAKTIWMITWKN